MKNSTIDYIKDIGHIYTCINSTVFIYNKDLEIIKEISLDITLTKEEEVTYFRLCEKSRVFHLVVGSTHSKRIAFGYSEGEHYYKFTFNGECISSISLTDKTVLLIQNYDNTISPIYNSDIWGLHSFDDDDQWKVIASSEKTDISDISLEYVQDSDNIFYEYITNPTTTNRQLQFAFIAINANYGSQSVQVVNLTESLKLEIVYELFVEDIDGVFGHLTFNSNGSKFCILIYGIPEKKFSIVEYSTSNNTVPVNFFNTNFEIHNDLIHLDKIESMSYINDNLLCIVRYGNLIIFDLQAGISKEIITRDMNSPYLIDKNLVIYYRNNKLTIKEYV